MPEEKQTFESALARLEEIVHALEQGNIPLEDSLKAFEEGIRLVRFCNGKLENAEQTVKILLDGGAREEDFPPMMPDDGNGETKTDG